MAAASPTSIESGIRTGFAVRRLESVTLILQLVYLARLQP